LLKQPPQGNQKCQKKVAEVEPKTLRETPNAEDSEGGPGHAENEGNQLPRRRSQGEVL